LSKKVAQTHRLQQRYDDLLKRHQSLIFQTMDAASLVSRAINLPFEDIEECQEAEESPAICFDADADSVF
jgi:hypothetical protein